MSESSAQDRIAALIGAAALAATLSATVTDSASAMEARSTGVHRSEAAALDGVSCAADHGGAMGTGADPTLPTVPTLPTLGLPDNTPAQPTLPTLPTLPNLPNLPNLPFHGRG
ncbi:hypothetical protein ACIHFE_08635 [Streptomyces sp. NPDC052396]|uniref:hypothetical protein n=1 Tax=Streptomyces sp. NPDC052396 TaxID=3365689 RepID=UPI0037D53FDD